MRINKYLSQVGFCSRREADKLIDQGRVTVNNVILFNIIKLFNREEDFFVTFCSTKSHFHHNLIILNIYFQLCVKIQLD